MYVVVRKYANASALADAMTKREQEVRDLISNVPGFVAYYATRDGGNVTSVTVCESREGTQESVRVAREWIQRNLAGSAIPAPEVSEGEAFIQF
ncbi:MAG TPA: hypothetical protein VH482_08875 [Thermomicrobiales bacterium]|jgi:hypothetical protein